MRETYRIAWPARRPGRPGEYAVHMVGRRTLVHLLLGRLREKSLWYWKPYVARDGGRWVKVRCERMAALEPTSPVFNTGVYYTVMPKALSATDEGEISDMYEAKSRQFEKMLEAVS